jgi:hypothetical protein
MRHPEAVELTGQVHDAYLTGPEVTPPAIVRFAFNQIA